MTGFPLDVTLEVVPDEDEAVLLAAREVVKILDALDALPLPIEHYNESEDRMMILDYDDVVEMIENVIRHNLSLPPKDVSSPFAGE